MSFLARDPVRGGAPMRVKEQTAAIALAPWERIGARLVPLKSETVLASGLFPFSFDAAQALLKALKAGLRRVRGKANQFVEKLGAPDSKGLVDEISDSMLLIRMAPLFTNAWLDDVLPRAMAPTLPALQNTDGEELVSCTVRWQLAPQTRLDTVRKRLQIIPEWLILGFGVVAPRPGHRRARREGVCPACAHCERTGRTRDRSAASPVKCPGVVVTMSAEATRTPPWC